MQWYNRKLGEDGPVFSRRPWDPSRAGLAQRRASPSESVPPWGGIRQSRRAGSGWGRHGLRASGTSSICSEGARLERSRALEERKSYTTTKYTASPEKRCHCAPVQSTNKLGERSEKRRTQACPSSSHACGAPRRDLYSLMLSQSKLSANQRAKEKSCRSEWVRISHVASKGRGRSQSSLIPRLEASSPRRSSGDYRGCLEACRRATKHLVRWWRRRASRKLRREPRSAARSRNSKVLDPPT